MVKFKQDVVLHSKEPNLTPHALPSWSQVSLCNRVALRTMSEVLLACTLELGADIAELYSDHHGC